MAQEDAHASLGKRAASSPGSINASMSAWRSIAEANPLRNTWVSVFKCSQRVDDVGVVEALFCMR